MNWKYDKQHRQWWNGAFIIRKTDSGRYLLEHGDNYRRVASFIKLASAKTVADLILRG